MKNTFATNVKNLRKEIGITQTELAEKIFVNKSMISAYEKGKRMPSLDVLIQLSVPKVIPHGNNQLVIHPLADVAQSPRYASDCGYRQWQFLSFDATDATAPAVCHPSTAPDNQG